MRKRYLAGALVLALIAVYAAFYFFGGSGERVLSKKVEATPTNSPTPSKIATRSGTPTPTFVPIKRKEYTVAVIGDSMVDTMGENMEYLDRAFERRYGPEVEFKLYNYGIGGQNVEQGLNRVNSAFRNKERNFPPIKEVGADVIVVGSFSYNTFNPHNPQKHRETLGNLVRELRAVNPNIYMLAEIAPLYSDFGRGNGGINWGEAESKAQAQRISEQLQNTVSLSQELAIPLINAYFPTQVTDGQWGSRYYTDGHDGIHPSQAGHIFTANLIARTVILP